MALPYPSMDFVPLDVLRADELDQLVANIEYLNTELGNTNIELDKRNWYCAGEVNAYADWVKVDLKKKGAWGIEVRAAAECTSGIPAWCDIRVQDENGNDLTFARQYMESNGTVSNVFTGISMGMMPMNAQNTSASFIGRSVLSGSANWRTWSWQSVGGNLYTVNGCARQQDGTEPAAITLVLAGHGNLYLGVWERDFPGNV